MILAIDTSGGKCGVALWDDNICGMIETEETHKHNEVLFRLIADLLRTNDTSMGDIKAVTVASGPGSFTGLRVGMAAAKGLCWTLQFPFIAIPTMDALAESIPTQAQTALTLVPARADEVYWALFEYESGRWRRKTPDAVARITDLPGCCSGAVFLHGEGYRKHYDQLNGLFSGRLISIYDTLQPAVFGVAKLAYQHFKMRRFDNLMEAEPNYCYAFPRR